MWRNLAAWIDAEQWTTMPGPAEWWEGYNFERWGFAVSRQDDGFSEAFSLLKATKLRKSFYRLEPSGRELRVLPDTPETWEMLRAYGFA
jgi:hypothetical protein